MTNYNIDFVILDRYLKENDEAREGYIYCFRINSPDYTVCKDIINWCKSSIKSGFKLYSGTTNDNVNNTSYFEVVTMKDADDALFFRLSW